MYLIDALKVFDRTPEKKRCFSVTIGLGRPLSNWTTSKSTFFA